MNGKSKIDGVLVGVVAVVALTACTSASIGAPPQATADKAGADPAPVTLRLGTEDDEGRPGAEQIRRYAAQVKELSRGTITIEPVWDANGDDEQGGWDQVVARMVMSGSLDMAMIPARAWDTEGVTSLRALQAPFLVTSDELAAEIATSDIAGELLAGLDAVGVEGLALAPESLRHLFVFGDPPRSVADFSGAVVRSPRSDTTWALFEALGARADDFTDPGESFDDAVAAGDVQAVESSFALSGTIPSGMTAIGNLPLFPKVNSLVINGKAHERLTDEQRQVLGDAAARMVDFAVDAMPDTVGYAEQYCRNDGTIVLADDAYLSELHRAVEPVYDDLSADAATASLIERIRAAGREIDAAPPVVAACGAADPSASSPVDTSAEFPEGVYRAEVSVESLLEAGIDPPTAYNHDGTWTMSFRDGRFLDPGCPGSTYSVDDGRVTIKLGPEGEGCGDAANKVLFSAAWTLEGDQLRFHDVRSGHGFQLLIETLFGRSWTKIG